MLVGVSAHQPSPLKCAKARERRWNLRFESASGKKVSRPDSFLRLVARRVDPLQSTTFKSTHRLSRRFRSKASAFERAYKKNRQCGCGTCRSAASCQIISLTVYEKGASEKGRSHWKRVLTGKPMQGWLRCREAAQPGLNEGCAPSKSAPLTLWISNQARRPAEFKHIIKRRKRN